MIRVRTAKRLKAVTNVTKMSLYKIVDEVTLVVTSEEPSEEGPGTEASMVSIQTLDVEMPQVQQCPKK